MLKGERPCRSGKAPASMGLADDLATRLAFESLSSLSGMASKVQETIEHNRAAFANQVALIDRQVIQKALYAWKLLHGQKVAKKDRTRRALARIMRGVLARAFFHWKDHYKGKDKSRAMRQKVRHLIAHTLVFVRLRTAHLLGRLQPLCLVVAICRNVRTTRCNNSNHRLSQLSLQHVCRCA